MRRRRKAERLSLRTEYDLIDSLACILLKLIVYKPQLNQQLLDTAKDSGVALKSGVKVNSVDVAQTKLELDNGESVSADVIIAADGVHVCDKPDAYFNRSPMSRHNQVCRPTFRYRYN